MKKVIAFMLFIVMAVSLVSCSNGENSKEESKEKSKVEEKKNIKIGCTNFSKISLELADEEIKKMGYEVEYVLFDTNILPLTAANEGSVDISFGQHEKFVENFNSQKGGDLALVEPHVYTTGIGLYSEKHKTIEDIPKGGKIAVMNDAMNLDRGLKILEEAGLIKLETKEGQSATVLDVKENPKELEFIEVEQMQTVSSLKDVDAAVIFFTHMFNAKKDVNSYLARDKDAKDYPMGIITKKENKDSKWATDIAKALKTETSQKKINEHFKDVFEFYN